LQVSGSCKLGDCGICSCDFSSSVTFLPGTWKRSGTTLTVTPMGYADTAFDYCVNGDTMTVRDPSGLLVTLERAAVSGAPTPCSQRTIDQCKLGVGCRVGACMGGATCTSAATETDCTVRQGCFWSADQCGGTAPPTCTLAEYGIVPGCVFTGVPRCTGTATACELKTKQQCSVPGCQAIAGCIGGAADCSQFSHACTFCNAVTGCSCDTSGVCVGSATCEQQSFFNCSDVRGCTWIECRGTPTPCQNLNELDCEQTPGCRLEMAPP
jgi:hypothetical protein